MPAAQGSVPASDGHASLLPVWKHRRVAIDFRDSVIVNFDTFGNRTRRSDKIENALRLTMPMVFGKMATASFDTLKAGQLVTNHDVIGSLASQGMNLTLDNGAVVHLRVLTRVGRDGPLAVGYLATITR